ncbi:hypothetical protein I8J29_17190, partial [Paenibacillus sp. MWE-103]|nr:hypothetical protein [Paenibacillus artemisiicola]
EIAAALELPALLAEPAPEPPTAGEALPAASGGEPDRRAAMADFLSRALSAEEGLLVRPVAWWGETDHVFSHIVWDVQVFRAEFGFWQAGGLDGGGDGAGDGLAAMAAEAPGAYGEGEGAAPDRYRWIGPEEMDTLAFPNVFVRILQAYWRNPD